MPAYIPYYNTIPLKLSEELSASKVFDQQQRIERHLIKLKTWHVCKIPL